jgi:enoyl-CoA hydratase
MRYFLTSDEFGAAEAIETARPPECAIAIAERIAACAPLGVKATLRSAWMSIEEGETFAAAHVRDDMAAVLKSDDFREGVASFKERRAAKFRGA